MKNLGPTIRTMFYCVVAISAIEMMWKSTSWSYTPHPLKHSGNYSLVRRCTLPPGGYRSWNQGMVTLLTPAVTVNCSRVIEGDEDEISRVTNITKMWKNSLSDTDMLEKVKSCQWLREYFSNNLYNSKLELEFPLAFTFVVYDSPQQVLRLLRLLYRPQNLYCLHCDVKSPHRHFFERIASCFDNVIMAKTLFNVVWGHYNVLGAQMSCMTDLLQLRATLMFSKWKYLINLCGKELPLLTNRQIVQRLMKLNGSSSVIVYKAHNEEVMNRITYPYTWNQERKHYYFNKHRKLSPPFNQSMYYKSSAYNALSFPFAHFLTTNSTAIQFHNFFKQCKSPEEHFYAVMFMMDGVPGGYNRDVRSHYQYVSNVFWSNNFSHECRGKLVHKICIVTAPNLKSVIRRSSKHLFHNKYFQKLDHTVMGCMEEKIVEKNKLEYYEEECE